MNRATKYIFEVVNEIMEQERMRPPSWPWIVYRFNTIVAAGYPSDREERKILMKLNEERIIQLISTDEDGIATSFNSQWDRAGGARLLPIQPKFSRYYRRLRWRIKWYDALVHWTSVFYWLKQCACLVQWICRYVWKHKMFSGVLTGAAAIVGIFAGWDLALRTLHDVWGNLQSR